MNYIPAENEKPKITITIGSKSCEITAGIYVKYIKILFKYEKVNICGLFESFILFVFFIAKSIKSFSTFKGKFSSSFSFPKNFSALFIFCNSNFFFNFKSLSFIPSTAFSISFSFSI